RRTSHDDRACSRESRCRMRPEGLQVAAARRLTWLNGIVAKKFRGLGPGSAAGLAPADARSSRPRPQAFSRRRSGRKSVVAQRQGRPVTDISVSTGSSTIDIVVAWARQRPRAALAWVLGLHLVVWTVLPLLVCRNLQLDLAEGLALGKEWQLGYWKHPPLPWWLDDLAFRLTGD